MTAVPDPITTPEQAYRELGRARALVEDRVDPLVGLILASVQTYLATSHPALDEPPFFGDWPPLERLALEGAAAAELAQDLDVATQAGFANARRDPIYADERKESGWDAALWDWDGAADRTVEAFLSLRRPDAA